MVFFTPEYLTHVAEIDEQHEGLINLLNSFESIEKGSHTKEELESTLNYLKEYIANHLDFEEKLMLESKYPEYNWHKNWHHGYIAKFNNLQDEFSKNGVSEEFIYILNEFIIKWIVRHIQYVDVGFGKHYNDYIKNR